PVPGPEAAAVDGAVPPPRTRPQQPATAESRAAAARIAEALAAVAAVVDAHVDELGRIDAVAGDGDHGIGMQRGAHAAASAAESARSGGAGAGGLLHAAADAWADRAGGTSGALWGAALRALGESLGDREAPTAATVAAGVAEATAAVRRLGGADVGDKTMVDVLVPFADALHAAVAAGARTADAWDGAAGVAGTAAAATADLLPRRGRARPHAERSLGTPDAGAHSLALIVRAVHPVLTGAATPTDRPTPKDTP
ncbi:DAK2 domain-containing protein, partial [Streptomyces lonarensis]|uniref:DAK2 domain-containing protein n=1 Tax=Streptomyces lonarensis TaxID=700599 RepID=UPI0030C66E88